MLYSRYAGEKEGGIILSKEISGEHPVMQAYVVKRVLAYLAGEILLLFVFDNNNIWVSRGWLIAVFLATLVISVWKCPRDPDQHKGE